MTQSPLLAATLAAAATLALAAPAQAGGQRPRSALEPATKPLIFGHRGASGYRPEHTLASYKLAIALGADYIEPDLVSTRDGVLVARHENEISGTTDVAEHAEFADRRTTKTIDGVEITGWFTEDFTLAELKTLRARERIPELRQKNTLYNDREQIPTLQEIIDLARAASSECKCRIGIAPETKHPSYFDSIGLSLEEPLVEMLQTNGYHGENAPVVVQSFEVGNLQQLARMTRVRLVQLLSSSGAPYDFVISGDPRTYRDLASAEGLADIARHAQIIGPSKDMIVPRDGNGASMSPTSLIRDAHAVGLDVVPYTFRNENVFLPAELRVGDPADPTYPQLYGRAFAEYRQFIELGVDGLFSDNPDTAFAARAAAGE